MLGLLLWCFSSGSSWSFGSSEFDGPIAAAVDEWWPDLPFWKLFKAQLIAESNLDPRARSGVGAEGIAQAMPATFRDLALVLKFPKNVTAYDAAYAIRAGAYYQGHMRTSWSAKGRTPVQRNDLGLCGYNRGLGNCIHDQAECGDAVLWEDISVCTARHTMETINYVRRINRIWRGLEVAE